MDFIAEQNITRKKDSTKSSRELEKDNMKRQ